MDFGLSARQTRYRDQVRAFVDDRIRPKQAAYHAEAETGERWKVLGTVERLKEEARASGL